MTIETLLIRITFNGITCLRLLPTDSRQLFPTASFHMETRPKSFWIMLSLLILIELSDCKLADFVLLNILLIVSNKLNFFR